MIFVDGGIVKKLGITYLKLAVYSAQTQQPTLGAEGNGGAVAAGECDVVAAATNRTASKSRDEPDTKQEQQSIPHATTNKSTAAECSSQQRKGNRRDRQKQQSAANTTTNKSTAATTNKVNSADTLQQTRQRQTHDNKHDSSRDTTTNKTTAAVTRQPTIESCRW